MEEELKFGSGCQEGRTNGRTGGCADLDSVCSVVTHRKSFRFQFYYFLRSLCCLVNNRTNERESILRRILVSALDIYLKLR